MTSNYIKPGFIPVLLPLSASGGGCPYTIQINSGDVSICSFFEPSLAMWVHDNNTCDLEYTMYLGFGEINEKVMTS